MERMILALLFLFISTANAAQDIPTLGISSPVYANAITNAEKALFEQTGANSAYHLLQDYTFGTSRSFLEKAGLGKEVGIIFFSYKIYRDKAVSLPLFGSTRITLHPTEFSINIRF